MVNKPLVIKGMAKTHTPTGKMEGCDPHRAHINRYEYKYRAQPQAIKQV